MQQKEVMQQTIFEARKYGRKLAAACSMISNCFEQGEKQEGICLLAEFFEGLEWFSSAVSLTQPLQLDQDISINLGQLPASLNPLVEALQNQDYVLVSDVLLHEVQPVLHSWSDELAKSNGIN